MSTFIVQKISDDKIVVTQSIDGVGSSLIANVERVPSSDDFPHWVASNMPDVAFESAGDCVGGVLDVVLA